MNYKTIKIFPFINFFYFSSNFNFFLPSNYNNVLFLIFLKKNNSYLKKIFNISSNFNAFNVFLNKSNTLNLINKFYTSLDLNLKYFLFNKNNNNLKLYDLKKKFLKNFFEYRNFLNFILNLKSLKFKSYFKKINIMKFFFIKKSYNLFYYNLKHVLLFLKLFLNYSDLNFFLKNNFIFLNRALITNDKFLNKNDIIEIIYFKFYFIYLFKIFKNIKNYEKYNNKNFNYSNLKNLKKSKIVKNFNSNKFFFFSKFYFYESDYKSLSFFFINSNFNFFSNFNYKNSFLNFFLFNLYKWKE